MTIHLAEIGVPETETPWVVPAPLAEPAPIERPVVEPEKEPVSKNLQMEGIK